MIAEDRYLEPFADSLRYRYSKYQELKNAIDQAEGGMAKYSKGYEVFGTHKVEGGITHREVRNGSEKGGL